MLETQSIIHRILRDCLVAGKEYHTPLAPELARWYCYTADGGHSIVILCASMLAAAFAPGADTPTYLVPAPVKSVLRAGYTITNDYVVVDLPYDGEVGLITREGEDEF